MRPKISDLAKRSGLTVRALHHYDAIGLLSPSARTESGARQYGQQDLIRLHRIQALKALGYALPAIRINLDDPSIKPLEIIERQIQVLDEQARLAQELGARLQHLAAHVSAGSETAAADWLNLLEMMTMYQRHLTDEEMVALRTPKGSTAHEISTQWTQLIAEVAQAMQQQMPLDGPRAQALAWRWMRLVIAMTSNNPVLANKLKAIQQRESRAREILGIDAARLDWIGQALAHARTALFAKYLSPAETDALRRRQLVGRILDDWHKLLALVRAQMEAGVPVDAEPVQALALRWEQLFRDSYCGDDVVLEGKVRHAFTQEPDLMLGVGMDEALMVYVQKAMVHLHRPQYSALSAGPKPSAKMVAIHRAVHQLLDSPRVLDDPLALRILGAADAATVQASLSQYQDPASRGLRTSLVVRSRLAEDEWAMAAADSVRQCVILGAGLDTYAYRRADTRGRIFEVDLPSTQAWKQGALRAANIEIPDSLVYVPIDFESSTLSQALAEAGFNAKEPAFFIWLGVAMYLDQQTVFDTLTFIASCSKASAVVFDYVVPASSLPPMMRAPIEMIAKHLAERGEPWKCYFEPTILAQKIADLGFKRVNNLTPEMLNQRYLSGRKDGLQMSGLVRLMHAIV